MKLKQACINFPRLVLCQSSARTVMYSIPLIWGFDGCNFAAFSSFKVILVCSLLIFQGMMWRGSTRIPFVFFFVHHHYQHLWLYTCCGYVNIVIIYLTPAGCFKNLRSMILQGQEVPQQKRYSTFICFPFHASFVSFKNKTRKTMFSQTLPFIGQC